MTPDELLRSLRLPVVAAPMFLVSGPELVVAAARAGILGAFPTQNCRTPEQLDEWLGAIASGAGTAPWAVNLITHRSNSRLADDLALVAAHRPPVVITALGSPRPVMDAVKGYGGLGRGRRHRPRPRSQGDRRRGSTGSPASAPGQEVTPVTCRPSRSCRRVRDLFDGLVTVGGGIADGAGVAGAVAAGADLVYMGTRFLATTESRATEGYKQMVVDHGPDDLVVSDGITGADASWLRPSLSAHGLDPDDLGGARGAQL